MPGSQLKEKIFYTFRCGTNQTNEQSNKKEDVYKISVWKFENILTCQSRA